MEIMEQTTHLVMKNKKLKKFHLTNMLFKFEHRRSKFYYIQKELKKNNINALLICSCAIIILINVIESN